MKKFVVYNKQKEILRTGVCQNNTFDLQAKKNEFVMEDSANDVTQKVEFDGFDEKGQPIDPRVVNKTPAEIEKDNPTPPEIPIGQRPASITNEQWQAIQDRLENLENSEALRRRIV